MITSHGIALGVLASALILNLFPQPSILSWPQRTIRNRALKIVFLCCGANFIFSFATVLWSQFLLTFFCFLAAAGLLIAHLRSRSSIWMSKQMAPYARMLIILAGLGAATLSVVAPASLIVFTLVSGIWHALVIRTESYEITKYFNDLKTKLVSLDAAQYRSHVSTLQNTLEQHGDKSSEAS